MDNVIEKNIATFENSDANFTVSLDNLGNYKPEYNNHFMLINDSTGMPLRQCKGRLNPIQPRTMLDKISPLGELSETKALAGGKKVVFTFDGGSYTIGEGNEHKSYIHCLLPQDGSSNIILGASDFRIFCKNALTRWLRSLKEAEFLSTKQTSHAGQKIDSWVKAYMEVQQESLTLRENFLFLARKIFSSETQAKVIMEIFDNKDNTRSENQQKMLAQIIGDNASKVTKDLRGTGYDILNGFTYYSTHMSPVKSGTDRNEANLIGSAQKFAEKAFNVLLQYEPDQLLDNVISTTQETSLIDRAIDKMSDTPLLDDILSMA